MKKLLGALSMISLLLCLGCAKGLPMKPSGPEDTLVVGRIKLEAVGFKNESDIPTVNGLHESGLALAFENVTSEEPLVIVSKSGGLFCANGLQPGMYGLVKLTIKVSGGRGYATMSTSFKRAPVIFPIEPAKVTNLGCLTWVADDRSGESYIRQEYAPAILHDFVAEKFPESAWLAREWLEVDIK